jgi:Icc-related predicted phosphoesterase
MTPCIFVSDLHGKADRYQKLLAAIAENPPAAVFLGGDLLPHGLHQTEHADFLNDVLASGFRSLRDQLGEIYPRVFLILGNDDPRIEEEEIKNLAAQGLWEYLHERKVRFGSYWIYGYGYVPPTPFLLKDWERYDVSRYVDPGCVSPEEGIRTVLIPIREIKYTSIEKDLSKLAGDDNLDRAVFLIHSPPYQTKLDRAALDGRMVDHAPLDVHVGSVAVRRFIEQRQPLLTLHGHIHESARLTGGWQDRLGRTVMFSAAHDGPQLALIRFALENLAEATRDLI